MSEKWGIARGAERMSISNDELVHWKYIDKYKKNGKWVYVYDKDKHGIKSFIDTKITGKAYKQHEDELDKQYAEETYAWANSKGGMNRYWDKKATKTLSDIVELNEKYYTESIFGKIHRQYYKGKNWLERKFPKLFNGDD